MGQIKWYKRDPEAALEGMRKLTLEQRGAYNTVLDLIYLRDGNLPDDDRFIAGWLDVDVRVWKRLKDGLIGAGKLRIEAGCIRNEKADEVVATALARVTHSRNAGIVSAQVKAAKSAAETLENSNLTSTTVEAPVATPVLSRETKSKKETLETNVSSAARAKKPAARKPSSLSFWNNVPDWVPIDAWQRFLTSRQQQRNPVTGEGAKRLIVSLEKLRGEGHDPGAVLDQSIERGWTGLFKIDPPKEARNGTNASHDHRDGYARSLDRRLGLDRDGEPARPAG